MLERLKKPVPSYEKAVSCNLYIDVCHGALSAMLCCMEKALARRMNRHQLANLNTLNAEIERLESLQQRLSRFHQMLVASEQDATVRFNINDPGDSSQNVVLKLSAETNSTGDTLQANVMADALETILHDVNRRLREANQVFDAS